MTHTIYLSVLSIVSIVSQSPTFCISVWTLCSESTQHIDSCCNLEPQFSGINTLCFMKTLYLHPFTPLVLLLLYTSEYYLLLPDTVCTYCYFIVIFSYLFFYFLPYLFFFIALSRDTKNVILLYWWMTIKMFYCVPLCQSVRMPSSQEKRGEINPHQGWQRRLRAVEVSNSSSLATKQRVYNIRLTVSYGSLAST